MLPCNSCGYRDRESRHLSGYVRCKAMFNPDEPVDPQNDLHCPLGKGIADQKLQRRKR